MVSLIIVEAALETIPKTISKHSSVAKYAITRQKSAQDILLDRSYHHAAMLKLKNADKRGRPDLVHFTLLEATSTPLYRKGMLQIYIHTIMDKVIFLHGIVRLPKSYFRFEGLMEQLFKEKMIKSNTDLLMQVQDMQFPDLLKIIKPSNVIGLSQSGLRSSAEEVGRSIELNTAVVIGGFPHGHFSQNISSQIDRRYSINESGLEAHVVTARVLYEYEKKLFEDSP